MYNYNNALKFYDPDGREAVCLCSKVPTLNYTPLDPAVTEAAELDALLVPLPGQQAVGVPTPEEIGAALGGVNQAQINSYFQQADTLQSTYEENSNPLFSSIRQTDVSTDVTLQGGQDYQVGRTIQNDSVFSSANHYQTQTGEQNQALTHTGGVQNYGMTHTYRQNLNGQIYSESHVYGDHSAIEQVFNMSVQALLDKSHAGNVERALVLLQRAKSERLQRAAEVQAVEDINKVMIDGDSNLSDLMKLYYFSKGFVSSSHDLATGIVHAPEGVATYLYAWWQDPVAANSAVYNAAKESILELINLCMEGGYAYYECAGKLVPEAALTLAGGLGAAGKAGKVADKVGDTFSAASKVDGVGDAGKISKISDEIANYLGTDFRLIKNDAGDTIFLSSDGTKRVRFDLNNPSPHSSPHGHVEEFINGQWVKSGPIYPTDVPNF